MQELFVPENLCSNCKRTICKIKYRGSSILSKCVDFFWDKSMCNTGQAPRNFHPAVELDHLTMMFFRFASTPVRQYTVAMSRWKIAVVAPWIFYYDEPARDVSGDALRITHNVYERWIIVTRGGSVQLRFRAQHLAPYNVSVMIPVIATSRTERRERNYARGEFRRWIAGYSQRRDREDNYVRVTTLPSVIEPRHLSPVWQSAAIIKDALAANKLLLVLHFTRKVNWMMCTSYRFNFSLFPCELISQCLN